MIDLMPTRARQLAATLDALKETGVPLVQRAGETYLPAGYNDDPGLYLVVPWIARTFGLSIQQAVDTFFLAVIVLAIACSLVGLWKWTQRVPTRVYGTVVITLLGYAAMRIGDVYILAYAVPVAVVPWILLLTRRHASQRGLLVFAPLAGLLIGGAHLVRSHSGTAVVLLFLILVLGAHAARARKLAAIALLLAGLLATQAAMGYFVGQRDEFLVSQSGARDPYALAHPFWHTVYIGFGYTDNPHVEEYADAVARDRVEQLEPGTIYFSTRYEEVLRDEVARLVTSYPGFVLTTLAAKLARIAADALLFLNLGLVALLWRRPPRRVMFAFAVSGAFAALPGILAIPRRDYLLGLYAFAVLFAVVALDEAWEPAGAWVRRWKESRGG